MKNEKWGENKEKKEKEKKNWREDGVEEGRGEKLLPGLFGLGIDRLSLSPNLSISPSSPSPSLTHSLSFSLLVPPPCRGAERCRENEGQRNI